MPTSHTNDQRGYGEIPEKEKRQRHTSIHSFTHSRKGPIHKLIARVFAPTKSTTKQRQQQRHRNSNSIANSVAISNSQSRSNRLQNYSKLRNNIAISCGLFYYLLLGIEETIMASFFSLEAQSRGLNTFQIGLAYTMMEVSNFLFSFVVMFFITPKLKSICCVTGIFITAVSCISVGFLQWVQTGHLFFVLSITIDFIVGIGAAMSLATVIPIITSLSLNNAGKITSWAEALLSLGGLIGPPFGSILYHYYNFCMPAFVAGGLLLICGFVSLIFLSTNPIPQVLNPDSSSSPQIHRSSSWSSLSPPMHNLLPSSSSSNALSSDALPCHPDPDEAAAVIHEEEDENEEASLDPFAYIKFIFMPDLLIVSMLGILVAAQMTFFDVCLSLYLDEVFKMSSPQIGLMFLAFGLSNVAMVPVYGIAVDRGYAIHVMLGSAFGMSIIFGVLSLPQLYTQLETVWFLVLCFIVAGGFSAGAMVPCYLIYEKIALIKGFNNLMHTKFIVATWVNNLFAIGALIGSLVLAGPVFQHTGFYLSCLAIAVSIFVFLFLASFVVRHLGLFAKLFYVDDDDDNSDIDSCNENEDLPEDVVSIVSSSHSCNNNHNPVVSNSPKQRRQGVHNGINNQIKDIKA